jgi:hypothetical protein
MARKETWITFERFLDGLEQGATSPHVVVLPTTDSYPRARQYFWVSSTRRTTGAKSGVSSGDRVLTAVRNLGLSKVEVEFRISSADDHEVEFSARRGSSPEKEFTGTFQLSPRPPHRFTGPPSARGRRLAFQRAADPTLVLSCASTRRSDGVEVSLLEELALLVT